MKENEKWVWIRVPECDKLNPRGRWIHCPVCGNKRFFHQLPTTVGRDIPVYCRKCKREYSLDLP